MKILGIAWLGLRTDKFNAMLEMFQDVMELDVIQKKDENSYGVMRTLDGDKVELFGLESKHNTDFEVSKPVIGFLVDNIEAVRKELQPRRLDLVGELKKDSSGYSWQHFRGPDGNLYELTFDPSGVLNHH